MSNICLVTGGGGFIGSHIVEGLLARGRNVRVLDNFSTGRRKNLSDFEDRIELIEGDIRDEETVSRAMSGVETVFHEAALASVPRSIEEPLEVNETNCTGTLKLLLAARQAGVRRFVSASSSSVYGDSAASSDVPSPAGPVGEVRAKRESDPCLPISLYGASKLAAEVYCRAAAAAFGLHTVSLRYFNVFGPRQNPRAKYAAVIPIFISRLLAGEEVTIHWDGEQTKDFTYVENVVSANILAAEGDAPPGGVFNIAGGGGISVNQLAGALGRIFGVEPKVVYAPRRPGDIKHSSADISAAEGELGYQVKIDFEEGLRRTVEWFRKRGRGS